MYTASISVSDTTSAITRPSVTAAQLSSISSVGTRARHSATSAIPTSCSARCTALGFHTRPHAVKYPDSAAHRAAHGMLTALRRSDRTVRASPIQRKPIGSASVQSISPAASPKNSA